MVQRCYFCNKKIGFFEENFIVRRAVKPPNNPYRYKNIGKCCESCSSINCTTIDKWKD